MSRKWVLVIIVAVAIIGCLLYGGLRFIYLIGHPSLGIMRGSASEADSRRAGLYIGAYTPTRRLVSLTDLSIIHVPDAWVEHAWKPELNWLLQERQTIVPGFYFYIPLQPDESTASKTIWPFKFALRLDQQAAQLTHLPGIGHDATLGYSVYLDTLPETIRFTVVQKQHAGDSWTDAIPVESIEFRRAF